MKKLILILALLAASPASAACYADYKAKKDNPLRLHYGVLQVPDAACQAPARAANQLRSRLEARLASHGWQLLNVVSIFDDSGLARRKESAGQFFLRF